MAVGEEGTLTMVERGGQVFHLSWSKVGIDGVWKRTEVGGLSDGETCMDYGM